jgi:DNA-binding SARP family transcriptional activator/tetratricopeptide (TPR) repeat protein
LANAVTDLRVSYNYYRFQRVQIEGRVTSMVCLHVLGETFLRTPTGAIQLRRREAALLTYISEHSTGRNLNRESVAAKFWPRSSTSRSLRSLSQLLYQLRHACDELGFTNHPKLIVHNTFGSDIAQLRGAVAAGAYFDALNLFAGIVLEGGIGSADVDTWLEALNREITRLVGVALRDVAERAGPSQERRVVQKVANRLLSLGMATEDATTALLVERLTAGDTAAAEHYHSLLQASSPDSGQFADFQRAAGRAVTPADAGISRVVRFVGRVSELRRLDETWQQVQTGRGQLVLISGEPGIGKTRLAEQFLRRAAVRGGRVWMAGCLSASKRLPYATLIDLWAHNIQAEQKRLPHLGPAFARLEDLLTVSQSGKTDPHEAERTRYHLLDGLSQILVACSELQPIVVFIDDAQWADELMAQLLTLWALRVPELPVMLLLTIRTEEAEPLPDWIHVDLPSARKIEIGQLSTHDASHLLHSFEELNARTFSEAVKNKVLWQSAGRPLLILEGLVAATSDADGSGNRVYLPESAEALLRRRFRNLTPECQWVCGLLAVLGKPQHSPSLPDICDLSDFATAACLATLAERGIVTSTAGKVGFTHDLMRETAYRQIPAPTRPLLHKRAIALLGDSADEGILAMHWVEAGNMDKAGALALQAAEKARRSNRYSDCEHYYGLAVCIGTADIRTVAARRYAVLLAQIGRVIEVRELLDHMGLGAAETKRLLRSLLELSEAIESGRSSLDDLLSRTRSVLEMSNEIEEADLALALGMVVDAAHDLFSAEHIAEIAEVLQSAALSSRRREFRHQIDALLAPSVATVFGFRAALKLLESREPSAADSNDLTVVLRSFALGTTQLLAGRLAEARSSLESCLALAQSVGDIRRQSASYLNSGLVALEMGDFRAARRKLEAALSAPARGHRLRAYANLAILHYEEGSDELALRTLEVVDVNHPSYALHKFANTAVAIRGLLHVRSGRLDRASALLPSLYEDSDSASYLKGDLNYTAPFVAATLAAQGNREAAGSVLDIAEASVEDRDTLCLLRLRLARARVLAPVQPDQAFAMAKRNAHEAADAGAVLIQRDARALLSSLR